MCHRRRRIAGGTAGSRRAQRHAGASRACLIGPAGRAARPVSSHPSSPRRSVLAVVGPAGGRGWSLAPPASATRPSGRCSSGPASPDRSGRRGSRPTATSGPAPATCCTWTPASTPASEGPATASPATAQARTANTKTASTSCTRSSTTTPGSPMSRSTATPKRRRSPASSIVRSASTPSTGSQRGG